MTLFELKRRNPVLLELDLVLSLWKLSLIFLFSALSRTKIKSNDYDF